MDPKPPFVTGAEQYETEDASLYNKIRDPEVLVKIAEAGGGDPNAHEARDYVGGVVRRLQDQLLTAWDSATEDEKVALIEEEIRLGQPYVKSGSELHMLEGHEPVPDIPAGAESHPDIITGPAKYDPGQYAPEKK